MSVRRLLPFFLIAAACWPTTVVPQARRAAVWFEGARLIIGDKSPTIENSAFLVEGDSFTWVGKKGRAATAGKRDSRGSDGQDRDSYIDRRPQPHRPGQ